MGELTVGLLMTGSSEWLGGIHYMDNLARAVRSLARVGQPRLVFFHPPGIQSHLVEPSLPLFDRVCPARSGSMLSVAKDLRTHGVASWKGQRIKELVRREGVDVLFPVQESLGARFEVPWIGWIPDFQHSVMPEFFGIAHRIVRSRRLRALIRDSTQIVLSSKVALQDMEGFAGSRWIHKARVLHFTCVPDSSWFDLDPSAVREKHNLEGPYFIVPNQFWVHKNHRDVIEAVKILSSRSQRIQVVCTGKPHDPRDPHHFSRLMQHVVAYGLQDQVRVLGIIPREEQMALMRGCVAVVQPSRFEGWSTVIEEARALGRRVVASNIAVHEEQAHPDAVYFTPGDAEQLAGSLWQVWNDRRTSSAATLEEAALAEHAGRVCRFALRFMSIAKGVVGGGEEEEITLAVPAGG